MPVQAINDPMLIYTDFDNIPEGQDLSKEALNKFLQDTFERAEEDGTTLSELRHYVVELWNHRSKFKDPKDFKFWEKTYTEGEPTVSDPKVTIGKCPNPIDNLPRLVRGDEGVEYAFVEGELFVDGVDPTDIIQIEKGFCRVAGSLIMVANSNKPYILDAMKDNKDGTYDVTFSVWKTFSDKKRDKVTITVDGRLPVKNGALAYLASRDPRELWGPIALKAWAVLQEQLAGPRARKTGYEEIKNRKIEYFPYNLARALINRIHKIVVLRGNWDKPANALAKAKKLVFGLEKARAYGLGSNAIPKEGTYMLPSHVYVLLELYWQKSPTERVKLDPALWNQLEEQGMLEEGYKNNRILVRFQNVWGEVGPRDADEGNGQFVKDLRFFLDSFHTAREF